LQTAPPRGAAPYCARAGSVSRSIAWRAATTRWQKDAGLGAPRRAACSGGVLQRRVATQYQRNQESRGAGMASAAGNQPYQKWRNGEDLNRIWTATWLSK